jgi:hypothetical protein
MSAVGKRAPEYERRNKHLQFRADELEALRAYKRALAMWVAVHAAVYARSSSGATLDAATVTVAKALEALNEVLTA